MQLAFFYLLPVIIILVLFIPKLIGFSRKLKGCRNKEEKEALILSLKDKYENSEKFCTPISDLKKIRPIIWPQIWAIVKWISVVFMLPIFLVRMALIFKRGTSISWTLPVSLYEVWQLLFVGISFYYSLKSWPILGMIIGSVVGISAIYILLDDLEKEDGILKIFQRPNHKLNLTQTIESGVVLMFSFASIFYALSILQPNSFHPGRLSILDSIYYSLITVATVGYGEIYPTSVTSKILVMLEVFLGLLYMLFIVTIFLSVFIQRQTEGFEEKKKSELTIEESADETKIQT